MGRVRWTLGAAVLLAVATPAIGGSATGRQWAPADNFSADDPAYAPLRALEAKAEALDDSSDKKSPAVRVAWQALYEAAIKVRVGRERLPHPLAGRALIAIANFDSDADTDSDKALEEARRSLELVRPFRDAYPEIYIQAVSTTGFILSGLGRPSEAVAPLGEGADWSDAWFAALPAQKRTRTDYDAKSNIEFAYSQALNVLGQADRAAEYQRRSMETRRIGFGPNDPDTVASYSWYGIMLFKAGHRAEAETYARLAVQTAIEHVDPSHISYARAFESLGLILGRSGRRSESIEYFQRSVALKRQYGGTQNSSFFYALSNLSDSLLQLERYDDAVKFAAEAAAGWQAKDGKPSTQSASAMSFAGVASAGLGDRPAAAKWLRDALAIARGLDAHEQMVSAKVLPTLITTELDLGRDEEARQLAAGYSRQLRETGSTPFAAAEAALLEALANHASANAAARGVILAVRGDTMLADSGELPQVQRAALDRVLRVAVGANDPQLALETMVILAGSKIAQANRLVTERLAAADPALADRIREQQDFAKTFQAADVALLKAFSSGGDIAEARRKRDNAQSRLDTARVRLMRDFPRWAEVSGTSDPDLPRIQAGLTAREAILAVVPAFDCVYTLTITNSAAQVRRTPLGRSAIIAQIARLRRSLPTDAYDTQAAYTLYEQFFPRADTAILRGVTSLRIVPAGPIASLPFAALLETPVSRIDGASPWLIRRFALEVSPSFATSAPATTGQMAKIAQANFLGIGAPTPFGTTSSATKTLTADHYFRGTTADIAALADLPALPGSATEVNAVAQAFGPARARLMLGDQASESAVRSMDLRPFSTILFATHGLVSGQMEGVAEPALVLARPHPGESGDGLLTSSEIATLRLDADWVILSACNTAAGENVEAPAYSGLAQAFRYAGARALLLSHWPVRDDAASFVTVATIANAQHGMRRDVALQQAMLKLMRDRAIPDAATPYIWAPYILVGSDLVRQPAH